VFSRCLTGSEHQKCPEIPFYGILMIVGGHCTGGEISLGGIFTCGIFNFLFACNSTTKGKQLDLAGRKGSEITLEGGSNCGERRLYVREKWIGLD
jgi:hypothetical protein